MIYSGHITVAGTTYSFGSEDLAQGSTVPGNATVIFTTQSPPPTGQQKIVTCLTCPTIPYNPNPAANMYIDFKFRQPDMGSWAGYVSAANPNTVSSAPVGCNNNQPYHVIWTGAAANPVINILP